MGNGIVEYSDDRHPAVRRIGNLVELRGAVKNNTKWTIHESIITIPEGFRPNTPVLSIQDAYGTFVYSLRINADGKCEAGSVFNDQYGIYEVPTGYWFSFSAVYFVD